MRRVNARLYACAIGLAAMAAAACGHAAVDVLTYFRIFSGSYATYRHSGIVLAVTVAAALALGFAAISVVATTLSELRQRFDGDRLAALSAIPSPDPKAFGLVFCLQIPMLLCVETLEQIQHFGHPLGFAASLGGPALVTLAIHAVCALVVATLSFRAIRAVAEASLTFARIVSPLIRRIEIAAKPALSARLRIASADRRRGRAAPLALRIANRPPPYPATS